MEAGEAGLPAARWEGYIWVCERTQGNICKKSERICLDFLHAQFCERQNNARNKKRKKNKKKKKKKKKRSRAKPNELKEKRNKVKLKRLKHTKPVTFDEVHVKKKKKKEARPNERE
ncbi:hypothetical protein POVWA2_031320 [Plasmodium ovale wallikeri]|uniref:Uncharacterized protein n=1 Tax=Plasmodium ovale wallikeri TaxID=864142 RepID=A0A1A8YYI5_PLAOA|nr:hypothetical protein POVWA2_031320 [Plasmodium ovale wallikeri]